MVAKIIGKKAINSFLVLVLALIIIAVVGFIIFFLSTTQLSERASKAKIETERELQKQITICNDDFATQYEYAGWGNIAYNVDYSLRLGGRRGLTAFFVELTDTGAGGCGVGYDFSYGTWNLTNHSYIRFSYKIEKDVPVCIIIRNGTSGNSWLVLATTTDPDCNYEHYTDFVPTGSMEPIRDPVTDEEIMRPLVADGSWHDLEMYYNDTILSDRMQAYVVGIGKKGDEYWLDEIVIASDEAYDNQFYCTSFEDEGGFTFTD